MSDARISKLAEANLAQMVDTAERNLDEIKTLQLVGGSDIVSFLSETGNPYDFTGIIPGIGIKYLLVTAVAKTMGVFYGNVFAALYTGSPPVSYPISSALADTASGSATPFIGEVFDAPNAVDDPTTKQWIYVITGDTVRTLSVKFSIEALDYATVTVTALN